MSKFIKNIRRNNLLRLIREYGSQKKLADITRFAPAYINQLATGRRGIGEGTARKIETHCGLQRYQLDIDAYSPTDVNSQPAAHAPTESGKIPLISSTSAGNWTEVMDDYPPGQADDWLTPGTPVGPHAFALRVRGDSMSPTITDGAIVVVDPDAEATHGKIVIARTNGHSEATCKRLTLDGGSAYLTPDNDRYPVLPVTDDTEIIGVVREVRQIL